MAEKVLHGLDPSSLDQALGRPAMPQSMSANLPVQDLPTESLNPHTHVLPTVRLAVVFKQVRFPGEVLPYPLH